MSEIEQVQAETAQTPELQKDPWLKKYLPSWWVFQPKFKKVKKPFKQEICEWAGTLLIALLIAFLARSFVFEPVRVDGNSMYPTLHNGEFMYVSKLDYGTAFLGIPFTGIGVYVPIGGEPERFDVIVCNYPNRRTDTGARQNFVKRVVGLPGDTVEIRDGFLYVNGVKYDEPFLAEYIALDYGPSTMGKGEYFVMGDNRNNSNDSRATGPITRDMIVGRVEGVIWRTTPSTLEYDEGALHYPRLRK